MITAAGIIDLLAIAPFVVSQLFDVDLRVIVLLRLLRFFKIARYSPGFHSLVLAIRSERHSLAACLVILIAVVLTSAGLMYVIEHDAQPDKFGSIPDAMWWAAATVTTVGYGDVVPITPLGRAVGVVTMITGLVMLALPAGIVASAFATTIARQNFVVTAGMLTRMPLFAGLEASAVFQVLPMIATRSFDRNAQIVHRGARAGTLYLLIEGEVEIEQARNRHRLGAGEAFGGVMGHQRDLSARALTRTKVLVIEEHDVVELCKALPAFADRLAALAPGDRRRQQAQEIINRLTGV
jgi:voltage-gated potassium channel